MVRVSRHRGLRELCQRGGSSQVTQGHVFKLLRILTALDQSTGPEGMNIPGFQMHPLQGRLPGCYTVSVSGNWRVAFRFEESHAVDVNYLDYYQEFLSWQCTTPSTPGSSSVRTA